MKNYLGFFLLLFTFEAFSKNTNSVLLLRGVVPVLYQIDIKMEKDGPKASIYSNHKGQRVLPRYKVTKQENNYLVSIVHP